MDESKAVEGAKNFAGVALQLVHSIEGGHFVRLGECGVIEYGIAEIFDRAAVVQHGLADVDDFGGALADGVNAEQLFCVAVKEQLQHAGLVAEHHALGQFVVFRDADFVGDFVLCECFFGFADHRDFGNGVNAERE